MIAKSSAVERSYVCDHHHTKSNRSGTTNWVAMEFEQDETSDGSFEFAHDADHCSVFDHDVYCTTVACCHMHPGVTSSWIAVCYKSRKVEATLDESEERENASLVSPDFDFPSVT